MRLPLAFLDMQLRGHSVLYMKQLEIFASLFFCLLMLLLLLISKPSRLMHLVAQAFYTFVIFVSSSLFLCVHMADLELGRGDGFNRDLGGQDGALTFAEALGQVNCQKLVGPEKRHFKSDRPCGDVCLGDLPLRNMDSMGGKVEQYADIVLNHKCNATQEFLDHTLY